MVLSIIFSAASLILCGFFFVYFRAWLGSRMGRDEKFARYREEVNQLVAAIDRATDRDAAIAEDRIQTLKGLIIDADERIVVLRDEQEKWKNGKALRASASYTAMGRSRLPEEAAAVQETAEPVPAAGVVPPETAVPAQPAAGAGERRPVTAEPPPAPRSFAGEVAELAAQGLSAELIARKLEASLAEVDLAMKIREGRSADR